VGSNPTLSANGWSLHTNAASFPFTSPQKLCQGPFGWMMTPCTSEGKRVNDVDLPDAASFASARLSDGKRHRPCQGCRERGCDDLRKHARGCARTRCQTAHPHVGTYIIATERLESTRAKAIIPGDVAISDSMFVVNYYRRTRDHRILFGGSTGRAWRFATSACACARRCNIGCPQRRAHPSTIAGTAMST
jgi:hypothetical protein